MKNITIKKKRKAVAPREQLIHACKTCRYGDKIGFVVELLTLRPLKLPHFSSTQWLSAACREPPTF